MLCLFKKIFCCNWNKYLFIVCTSVILGIAVPVGFGFGIVGPLGQHVKIWTNQTFIKRFDVHLSKGELETIWATVISIFLIGGAIGSLGGGWISNQLGRKTSVLVCYCLYIIGSILFLACRLLDVLEILLLARLISGLGAGLSTSTAPMYLSEVAPIKLRGSLAVLFSLGLNIGIVIGAVCSLNEVLGNEYGWHYALSFYGIFVLIAMLPFPFLPESPKYLYAVAKQKQKSIEALTLLRGSNFQLIEYEIKTMEKETTDQTIQMSISKILWKPEFRLPLILACFIQIGQQFSGVTAVAYYTVPLFESTGFTTVESKWGNFGLSNLNIIFACFSPLLMAKFKRRSLLICSCFSCAISLLFLTIGVALLGIDIWPKVIAITATAAFIVSFHVGLSSIPYFIASELFESTSRSTAMTICSIISWTFNFASAMAFPSLQYAIGAYVFLPYLITLLLLAVFLIYYLPETSDCNPTEVAAKLSHGFKSNIRS